MRVGLFPTLELPLTCRLYTHPRTKPTGVHNTDYYLHGLEALGLRGPFDRRMMLEVSEPSEERADGFLRGQADTRADLPLVVLHPGASQPSKCWPTDRFAAVAAALSPRCNVVVTGSPNERPLAQAIADALPEGTPLLIAAGGVETIGTTAALIGRAAAIVTGDTSALHVASALGTPLIGIYGSTRPGDNAPLYGLNALLNDDAVPCAPCYQPRCPLKGADHLRCQRAVTPAQVLAALDVFLNEGQRTP